MKINTLFPSSLIVLFILFITVFASCKKEETSDSSNPPAPIVQGCMDTTACNYDQTVTEDNGSCVYAEVYYNCDGNCINDVDSDGICDELEIAGCNDATAFNYDPLATDDDGSCEYASSIMVNTWTMNSDCDGMFVGLLLPEEVTISAGDNKGELILDLGTGVVVEGFIDAEGNITIPSQAIGLDQFSVNVSGSGQLESVNSATINVSFVDATGLFINENCVLTLSM